MDLSDLKAGDVVSHAGLGRGTVHEATGQYCIVVFDEGYDTTHGIKKKHVGRYDADWFKLHPSVLRLVIP